MTKSLTKKAKVLIAIIVSIVIVLIIATGLIVFKEEKLQQKISNLETQCTEFLNTEQYFDALQSSEKLLRLDKNNQIAIDTLDYSSKQIDKTNVLKDLYLAIQQVDNEVYQCDTMSDMETLFKDIESYVDSFEKINADCDSSIDDFISALKEDDSYQIFLDSYINGAVFDNQNKIQESINNIQYLDGIINKLNGSSNSTINSPDNSYSFDFVESEKPLVKMVTMHLLNDLEWPEIVINSNENHE